MQVTMHPTSKIVEIVINGAAVPARVWEGLTNHGVPVQVLVTRIALAKSASPGEVRSPTALTEAIPLRMIL